MTWLDVVLGALATFRLTRLWTDDEITEDARGWLLRRLPSDGKLAYLVGCPWCISMYVGAGVAVAAWLAPSTPYTVAAAALSFSAVAGLLAAWE